ncbi:SDR family oxidoreductase [Gordonia sp. DT219]|uniref:SDR family oxidoreductase n=1 Tax=Gordonia sp. DT219 TaxID=3416658 RepID=UPI003CF7BFD1
MTTYAVTGATGKLGDAAVRALLDRGVAAADVVAIVRDPAKAAPLRTKGVDVRTADYGDPGALRAALSGVERLLLVSGSEVGQRVDQHRNVIEAAKAAGVALIAYTSILRADTSPLSLATEHVATEELLNDSGIPSVFLRNGWYWENYLASAPTAVETGTLFGSAGDGVIAAASRLDYASAAAAALVDATGGEVYELAGDEHLTYAQIAQAIAEISGRPVGYRDLAEADYAAALTDAGIPAPMAAVLADSDAGVAKGALDSDSTDLQKLIGRSSTPLAEVLRTGLAATD